MPDPERPSFDDYLRSRQVDVREGAASIEARFWRFHRAHPDVYAEIVRLCRAWRAAEGDRWGIDGAFAVLRWERQMAGLPDAHETYKLNDHYRSRYARLIQEQEPDLAGIFETRALRSRERR